MLVTDAVVDEIAVCVFCATTSTPEIAAEPSFAISITT